MGCAENNLHRVETGDHQPLKLRPIKSSKAGDLEVQTEIPKIIG